jgi:hypothetical protein
MRNVILSTAAALLISPVVTDSAFSQSTPPSRQNARTAPDPDEIVCEKQQVLGSRLASHRICMTRAEWAEQRRIQRMDVEHVQMQRGCSDKC